MLAARTFTRLATKVTVAPSVRCLATTKFTSSHEYVKVTGDVGTVGITGHAASALGDIVFVDLPNIGASFSAGDVFGSVESVKAASDVYSPVSGEVVAVNEDIKNTPGLVNESPLEGGWFMKIKLSDAGKTEFKALLDEAAYKKVCDEDHH